jgi:hypothetical protein
MAGVDSSAFVSLENRHCCFSFSGLAAVKVGRDFSVGGPVVMVYPASLRRMRSFSTLRLSVLLFRPLIRLITVNSCRLKEIHGVCRENV